MERSPVYRAQGCGQCGGRAASSVYCGARVCGAHRGTHCATLRSNSRDESVDEVRYAHAPQTLRSSASSDARPPPCPQPCTSIVVRHRSRSSCIARGNLHLAVSGVCAGPAVEAPPEQGPLLSGMRGTGSAGPLHCPPVGGGARSALRGASYLRPQALRCAGKPPQAAGDVGRPGAHTAHRRLQRPPENLRTVVGQARNDRLFARRRKNILSKAYNCRRWP